MQNNTENSVKTNINWFPGHMAKAKRMMVENLKKVDMVIELRDCRIPLASANPMLDEILKDKKRLIILSKQDKGEMVEIQKWIQRLENESTQVIAMDLLHDNVLNKTIEACKKVMHTMLERMRRKGIRPRAIRAMVVGIPNVGKSTFINQAAQKRATKTSDRPGVTRDLQWVKCSNELELLDTPGVLWPKFEDEKTALHLAITGAIKDEVLPLEEITAYAIERLSHEYPERLYHRYGFNALDQPHDTILAIGLAKKWLKSGNEVDYERACRIILNEIRDDRLGGITWEKAED